MGDKSIEARLKAVLEQNNVCADCPAENPLWASYLRWPMKNKNDESQSTATQSDDINVDIEGALGVVICNDCAQHHHFELGKKRCLIKYLKYSHEVTGRDLAILETSGNAMVNQYYEAYLFSGFQKALVLKDVEKEADRRGKFIKEKYKKVLWRDHAGLRAAVQQSVSLQIFQHDMQEENGKRADKKPSSSSSKNKKDEEKIAAAVAKIQGAQSKEDPENKSPEYHENGEGEDDGFRVLFSARNRKATTSSTTSNEGAYDFGSVQTNQTKEEEEEEAVPRFNPTGKSYADDFNLTEAKKKEEEKNTLLKELIERDAALPDDDDEEDDVSVVNDHAGWGLNNLKNQLAAVKSVAKNNEVRTMKPRERGLNTGTGVLPAADLATSNHSYLPASMTATTTNAGVRRTTSLDSNSNLKPSLPTPRGQGMRRTGSLDENAQLKYEAAKQKRQQHANLQEQMNTVHGAIEKTKDVAESLKKTAGMDSSSRSTASTESRNQSEMNSSTRSQGGRRNRDNLSSSARSEDARRNRRDIDRSGRDGDKKDTMSNTTSLLDSGLRRVATTTEDVLKNVDDASAALRRNKTSTAPARRVMRRGSSLSDLDKFRSSGNSRGEAGEKKRSGRKKKTEEENKKCSEKECDTQLAYQRAKTAVLEKKFDSEDLRRNKTESGRTRRAMRRSSSVGDLNKLKSDNQEDNGPHLADDVSVDTSIGSDLNDKKKKKKRRPKKVNSSSDISIDSSLGSADSRNRSPRRGKKKSGSGLSDVSGSDTDGSSGKMRDGCGSSLAENLKRMKTKEKNTASGAASVASMPVSTSKDRKKRSKSPKPSDVGDKLAALPGLQPKFKKDAKSVASMPASSSRTGRPLSSKYKSKSVDESGDNDKSRSREKMAELSKSLTGLAHDISDLKSFSRDTKGKTTSKSPVRSNTAREKMSDLSKSLTDLGGLPDLPVHKAFSKDAKSVATAPVLKSKDSKSGRSGRKDKDAPSSGRTKQRRGSSLSGLEKPHKDRGKSKDDKKSKVKSKTKKKKNPESDFPPKRRSSSLSDLKKSTASDGPQWWKDLAA